MRLNRKDREEILWAIGHALENCKRVKDIRIGYKEYPDENFRQKMIKESTDELVKLRELRQRIIIDGQ